MIKLVEQNTNTSMNTTKNRTAFYITLFIGVILIFQSFMKRSNENSKQNKFKYSGTYSLYIENAAELNFYWVTETADIGSFEIIDADKNVIASGDTESSRTHSVNPGQTLKNPFTFRFGGQKDGMHEIRIRPDFGTMKTTFKKVDSLYVLGDIHGRYDELINLLQQAALVDEQLNWTGGSSHAVFLGDLFDRGDDVTKVLWFIYELEEKAALAGGMIHLVLGNHEIMTMTKDLRYVSRKESSIAVAHQKNYDELFHPLNSFLGAWLRSKPSVLKIDDVLFAHGGIVDLGPTSLKDFNKKAYNNMKDPIYLELMKDAPDSTQYDPNAWQEMQTFFYHEESPYWYRGYVYADTLGPQLKSMLKKYNSKIHVVAHTPLETITERYKGQLLTTDLNQAATELLFLVKTKNKYQRYKIDSNGNKTKL